MMKEANAELHMEHSKAGRYVAHFTASEPAVQPSDEERISRIAVSAYYKAEARGFAPGCELKDWLAAEAEEKSWSPQ